MHFTSIVIAGGALKVISVIGCIKYLEEKNMVTNMKNFAGTSAGSIMCLFLVLGFTYAEMIEFLYVNLSDKAITSFDPEECLSMLESYGLNSGGNLELLIQRMLFKKLKVKDITFIELAKITGKNLVVCVSNLTKERSEFFSVDTMPQLSVVTAIRVSCCIPILFTPISINDDVFMDGGLYDNFPIDYFKHSTLKDILGINVIYKNYQRTDTFFNYMMFILSSLLDKVNTKSMNDTSKNIVTLDFEEDDWFSITELCVKFPKERWSTYVQYGYNRIKQQLEQDR